MTAGQDRHQRVFDHAVLAENNGGDRFLCAPDLTGDLLGRTDDHVLEFFDTVCASHSVSSLKTPPMASSYQPCQETCQETCHDLILNLCEGRVFVELNYPHIIGISGYERHH